MVSLNSYIRELLRKIDPSASISSEALDGINNLLNLLMKKLVEVASDRVIIRKRKTLGTTDIRFAARFVMKPSLYESAVLELRNAVINWNSDFTGPASKRAKIIFPPTRISTKLIRPLTSAPRLSAAVGVALAAVAEHVAAVILGGATAVASEEKRVRITPSDVQAGIEEMPGIASLFEGVLVSGAYIKVV